MDPKRIGWLTTEFWAAIIPAVAAVLAALGFVPVGDKDAFSGAVMQAVTAFGGFVAAAIAASAYIKSRADVKMRVLNINAAADAAVLEFAASPRQYRGAPAAESSEQQSPPFPLTGAMFGAGGFGQRDKGILTEDERTKLLTQAAEAGIASERIQALLEKFGEWLPAVARIIEMWILWAKNGKKL